MQWPVQIEREKKHFPTEHADGFDAAAALLDDLAARIQSGALAPCRRNLRRRRRSAEPGAIVVVPDYR